MVTAEPSIKILGLTRADQMDIEGLDTSHQVAFEEKTAGDGRFGEPLTVIAILGVSALGVLAAWVVKTRENSTTDLTIETTSGPTTWKVRYKKRVTKETSEGEVLKELTALIRGQS